MPEKPSFIKKTPVENECKRPEPVGIRIIGELDPSVMTLEEFERSSDLLFHGSLRPMNFLSEFDYRSRDYLLDNDGSTTLGFGFYATASKQEASHYSLIRQGNKTGAQPIVISILPYQARVLDLRSKDDLTKNASISREFANKWRAKFLDYLKIKLPRKGNDGTMIDEIEAEYALYIDRVLVLDEIDLRVLLETAPASEVKSRNMPSPSWTVLFSDFMREEGYDGLIYNEGSEGKEREGGASYVFFNLQKIGTYESWHKRRNTHNT